jgi:hypothetical protein
MNSSLSGMVTESAQQIRPLERFTSQVVLVDAKGKNPQLKFVRQMSPFFILTHYLAKLILIL